MKQTGIAAFLLLILAVGIGAFQAPTPWILGYISGQQWVRLGPGLKLTKPSGSVSYYLDTVASVPPPAASLLVIGSPAAPGCAPTPTAGVYAMPRPVLSVAVYRNGIRAVSPGEFTLNGAVLTITAPLPGEIVLCDYY